MATKGTELMKIPQIMRTFAVLVCMAALPASPAHAQSEIDPDHFESPNVPAQKKMPVAASLIAAWNSHDAEKVVAIFTTDVLYEDVALGAVNHGSAELRKFAASVFEAVPDAKFELVNSSVDRGHGSIEWIFSGTDHVLYKTGKRFSVRGVSVIDLHGGKISRDLDYWNAAAIMRQVGLLPPEKTEPGK
jgi:steroid delta-isomerase-like uncharacterized protein